MSSFSGASSKYRGIRIALGLSLLAHALLLAIPVRHPPQSQDILGAVVQSPLSVQINAAAPPTAEVAAPAEPVAEPQPVPRPPRRPRAVARTLPQPEGAKPVELPLPAPRAPDQAPEFDMAAMIAARREQRRAAAAREKADAEGKGREPGADDAAQANINRNLATLMRGAEGTSGVFQILRKGHRSAEFSFNGWKPDAQRRWREVIEVLAKPDEDIELAIVRRMIALIRGHYAGDFNWESHRLGRVIVLSARPEDSEGLEDFLLREFFDTRMPRK